MGSEGPSLVLRLFTLTVNINKLFSSFHCIGLIVKYVSILLFSLLIDSNSMYICILILRPEIQVAKNFFGCEIGAFTANLDNIV